MPSLFVLALTVFRADRTVGQLLWPSERFALRDDHLSARASSRPDAVMSTNHHAGRLAAKLNSEAVVAVAVEVAVAAVEPVRAMLLLATVLVAAALVNVAVSVVAAAVRILISGGATSKEDSTISTPRDRKLVCKDAVKLEESLTI